MTEETLEELLGVVPPAAIVALPAADQAALAEVISAARRTQAQDLSAAFDATLKYIPFPLRGVVKRVLMG